MSENADPVYVWVVGSLLSIGIAAGLTLFVAPSVALGAVALMNIALATAHWMEIFTLQGRGDEPVEEARAEPIAENKK